MEVHGQLGKLWGWGAGTPLEAYRVCTGLLRRIYPDHKFRIMMGIEVPRHREVGIPMQVVVELIV